MIEVSLWFFKEPSLLFTATTATTTTSEHCHIPPFLIELSVFNSYVFIVAMGKAAGA